jgi:hypothetical protein
MMKRENMHCLDGEAMLIRERRRVVWTAGCNVLRVEEILSF